MRLPIMTASLLLCLPLAALGAQGLTAGTAQFPPAPAAPGISAAPAKPAVTAPASRPTPARAAKLLEPHLHVAQARHLGHPRVALTFDACMGKADERILSTLVRERIPATIFVTARWLKYNAETLKVLKDNPDLFQLEDHGENHIPAVSIATSIYGIASAGSPEAVEKEVLGGAEAMRAAGIAQPRWFRGATAKYDPAAIQQIRMMGYRIAGYSLNGDDGSLLGAAMAEKRIAGARDGDVIIAHINQPTHSAGEGVARGILALKAKGAEFVRLQDVEVTGDGDTTRILPGMPAL